MFTFSIADTVATARMFVGLNANTSTTSNANPSTFTNAIGVGCDASATNLYMMHNDGAGACTTVDLGASFPTNAADTDVYELVLYAPPNGSTVGYRVTRLNTGDTTSGTLSTNLPANTQLLTPHFWRNNSTTATAVDLVFMNMLIETEN